MAELPSGTVTFLLTDVEGSTTLWEEAPEAMHAALLRHDALFDEACRDHHGVHIRPRGEGDSRFAVFVSAPDAVAAAIALQRRLTAEPWPTPQPIRVRIGLHTGEARLRDGDYYGSTVNRCARLREIGHGGQTLLSEATSELVRARLPGGANLLDLGRHRLKGLTQPEGVFQVVIPGLARDFPAVTSLDARPNNLPIQPTPLLGREREVQAVRSLLLCDDVRLVTLTGPGGTGKTRLALQVAADLLDHFPDGVSFVELAPISEPDLVTPTMAHVLGLREGVGRSLKDTVTSYLKEKHLLLLLDNFEQLLTAAPVVADLLAACPRLRVLVTSRAVLHLRGEREFSVSPLALPDPKREISVEALGQYAAVALFVQRAVDAKASFRLTNENAPTVAEICRRLDGLPLAIELAAARIKVLSPEALVARLERRLPLLTGGARDLPTRQQTLRDAIAWSYDLLTEPEQRIFRWLGVFVGGFTLTGAETVCARAASNEERGTREAVPLASDHSILDAVFSLVDKSLLRQLDSSDADSRFTMLETIREYALERLEESGQAAEIRDGHVKHYLALAEEAEQEFGRPGEPEWLDRLEAEHDNLRVALHWMVERNYVEMGLRLGGALWRFWYVRGLLSEGREQLARVLAPAGASASTSARLKVLNGAGVLAHYQGDYTEARALHEECLAIGRALADKWIIADSLGNLGRTAQFQGDGAAARALYEASLEIVREMGDTAGVASALYNLGFAAHADGDYGPAMMHYEESLALYRRLGDQHGIQRLLHALARVEGAQGNYARASELYQEGLRLCGILGQRPAVAWYFEGVARIAQAMGQPQRAARLLGAADTLRGSAGVPLPPAQRAAQQKWVATVRAELGDEAFAAGESEGLAMTFEQAVAYALDEQPPE